MDRGAQHAATLTGRFGRSGQGTLPSRRLAAAQRRSPAASSVENERDQQVHLILGDAAVV